MSSGQVPGGPSTCTQFTSFSFRRLWVSRPRPLPCAVLRHPDITSAAGSPSGTHAPAMKPVDSTPHWTCGSACLAAGGVSCCGVRFELVGGLPVSAGHGTPRALLAACPCSPFVSRRAPGQVLGCCLWHWLLPLPSAPCLAIVAPDRPPPQYPRTCLPRRPPQQAAGLTLLWSGLGGPLPHSCRPFLCCSLWVSSSWRHRPSTAAAVFSRCSESCQWSSRS